MKKNGKILKAGYQYSFDPEACKICKGKCCSGDSGTIFVSLEEISKIHKFLEINKFDFIQQYLIKTKNRLSIKEIFIDNNFFCIFFNQEKNKCNIYSVRPKQCRTFPFWPYFKENFKELKKECLGVNKLP